MKRKLQYAYLRCLNQAPHLERAETPAQWAPGIIPVLALQYFVLYLS